MAYLRRETQTLRMTRELSGRFKAMSKTTGRTVEVIKKTKQRN